MPRHNRSLAWEGVWKACSLFSIFLWKNWPLYFPVAKKYLYFVFTAVVLMDNSAPCSQFDASGGLSVSIDREKFQIEYKQEKQSTPLNFSVYLNKRNKTTVKRWWIHVAAVIFTPSLAVHRCWCGASRSKPQLGLFFRPSHVGFF